LEEPTASIFRIVLSEQNVAESLNIRDSEKSSLDSESDSENYG
jgi:hypothetical protein